MVLQMFVILDAKSGAYAPPFFAFNAAVAQRNVAAAVQSGDSLIAKFPEDYTLYAIGQFDDATAEVRSGPPQAVCNLSSLREKVHAS